MRAPTRISGSKPSKAIADVVAIQSEIAKAIADQLQAQLSPAEKTAIEKPPTTDLAAFDLYTRGKTQLLTTAFTITSAQNFEHAVELLNRAVTRDPVFVEAYYQLAYAHGRRIHWASITLPPGWPPPKLRFKPRSRLRLDAGETHLARAQYLIIAAAITPTPLLNWKMRGEVCLTIRASWN